MTFGGQNPYGPWRPDGTPAPGVPPQGGTNPYAGPNLYAGPHPYAGSPPYRPYVRPRSLWRELREDEWPPLRELLRRLPVHGCIWAVLFCFSPAFLLLLAYPVARSARRQARRKFSPYSHRRIQDPEMMRVQKVRAWLALAASFLILVVYGSGEDWAEIQAQFMLRLTITPWLLLLSAPVVIAVLFRLAPPAARPEMRARLRPALRSVLWYFGAFTAVPLMCAGVILLGRTYQNATFAPFIVIALMYPVLWVVFFVVFASPTVVRSVFGVSEVHAALPALLTGVLVWELAAINLTAGMPPGPLFIQIGAVLGGPASVTAVAWWEVERLRRRFGVRLRG
ncbi:hypothetical protein [Streptomyces sp. NBC_00872]|uniref:hypothetical protein n=1 Tax=Streptomyces sp. NBC_00872 TaxID=2903686 RepID=UPI003863309A|nr:hypothetical protein OG214_06795 [Streptomyces sp. NBC_00872]